MIVLTLSASLSLTLFPAKSNAVEPISTVIGIVATPIFCKMIQCKTHETKVMFTENPTESRRRLQEMKRNFKWDDYYEDGDCVNSHNKKLDKQITVCYIEGKWKVIDD